MTYELAKQLKDAGFPQGRLGSPGYVLNSLTEPELNINVNDVYYPTLSELIEACEKKIDKRMTSDFEIKHRIYSGGSSMVWGASVEYSISTTRFDAMGDTPEEAVAKLWLEIRGEKNPNF